MIQPHYPPTPTCIRIVTYDILIRSVDQNQLYSSDQEKKSFISEQLW